MAAITKELLEQEIQRLVELENSTSAYLACAKQEYKNKKENLEKAIDQHNAAVVCKRELEWQLQLMQEKEARGQ